MGEGWKPTQDWSALLRLHRKWNPGLYELADQYSHLRSSDLISKDFRGGVYRQNAQPLGYALAQIGASVPVFYEIWCECVGIPSWRGDWQSDDKGRLEDSYALLSSTAEEGGGRLIVRVPRDNAFGLLLVRWLRMQYKNTFLLATRRPGSLRVSSLPEEYAIRPYVASDGAAFHKIHLASFQEDLGVEAFARWASSPSSEAFAATFHGRVVGFAIAEVRRGGKIGDLNLAVKAGHHRQGLGTALLDRAMRSFEARGVETVVADHWALLRRRRRSTGNATFGRRGRTNSSPPRVTS